MRAHGWLKKARLGVTAALLLPMAVGILLYFMCATALVSFKRYADAQVDFADLGMLPEPDLVFNIKDSWKTAFEHTFPELCKKLYEDGLPFLFDTIFVGIFRTIAKFSGSGTILVDIRIENLLEMWTTFVDILAGVDLSDIDVSRVVDLNYLARMIVAALETICMTALIALQSASRDEEESGGKKTQEKAEAEAAKGGRKTAWQVEEADPTAPEKPTNGAASSAAATTKNSSGNGAGNAPLPAPGAAGPPPPKLEHDLEVEDVGGEAAPVLIETFYDIGRHASRGRSRHGDPTPTEAPS